MQEKLDFSLPEKKQKSSALSKILVALALVLVGLMLANLLTALRSQGPVREAEVHGLSAEQTRQLASKLAQRSLYTRAAKVWQDYLSGRNLGDVERAKVLFEIGTLLEKANHFDEAIEYYYRSETVAKLGELEPQINSHIKDCFEKLGKFSALRYELMDRTSLEGAGQAGGKILAEIGSEKITEADLDAIIEDNIDNQLEPMAEFMWAEQLNEQKKEMLKRYRDPEVRGQFLQGWLAQEILYRQALEEGLGEEAEVKKLLGDLARGVLSQRVMNRQLVAKINITETDVQTYYEANRDKYVEPAKARISHILVDDEARANELMGRIKDGEDFNELAKEFSMDESTRENGGKIDAEVSKGPYVPTIGESKEINEKIFSADAPSVLDEAVETEKGWEIVKVDEVTAERQKSFDEVRQQVMTTLVSRKRQDVQREYIEQMMDKYNVIVHTSVLTGTEEDESVDKPLGMGE
ncbi:MAG: peptidyl-prolyl cis-trans isomerase [Planctomycetota bacterium]|nr:MAG: peptidyl-prolyl cis-trans isomerase [Planctomycetota bacterium]